MLTRRQPSSVSYAACRCRPATRLRLVTGIGADVNDAGAGVCWQRALRCIGTFMITWCSCAGRNGGKAGRGSENKRPFVIAVETTEDGRPRHAAIDPEPGLTKAAFSDGIHPGKRR